jgi:hypothetical protein
LKYTSTAAEESSSCFATLSFGVELETPAQGFNAMQFAACAQYSREPLAALAISLTGVSGEVEVSGNL